MKKTKISHKQLMTLVFIGLLSPVIRSIPENAILLGGKAAWVSPLIAAVPILLLYALIRGLMKKRADGDGLSQIIFKAYGPWFGRVITVIFVLWLTFLTGFTLRIAAERLISYIYNDSYWTAFAAVILIASCIAASGQVNSIVRTAQVFVPIVLGIFIVVALLLMPDVKVENLLPLTFRNIPDMLLGSIHMIGVLAVFAYYVFLDGYTQDSPKEKGGIGYLISLIAVIFVVIVATVGILSAEIARTMQSPFFIMIRNIKVWDIMDRIEAIVVALWAISDFIFISSMLMIDADVLCTTIKAKKRAPWVWVLGAASFAAAILMSSSAFGLEKILGLYAPAVNIALAFIVVPITLLIAKVRKVL